MLSRSPARWVVLSCSLQVLVGCPSPAAPDGGTDAALDTVPTSDTLSRDTPPVDAPPADHPVTPTDASPDALGLGPDGLFPASHFFYRDVSALPVASESAAMLARLQADGGWGNGNVFQIDFSFVILTADGSTPTHVPSVTYTTDSDLLAFPFPAGGAIEGETGYQCTMGGDCHMLVIQQDARRLFEGYVVDLTGGAATMTGEVVWHLDRDLGDDGRGQGCTSADAAGFPITPGLIRLSEIAADDVRHALRFTLPNNRMRRHAYVAPATHYGAPSNRNPDSIPYGTRLRLRASFDESNIPSAGGRAVVRALKRYGMLLSDGGNIALMGESDQLSSQQWRFNGGSVPLGPQDLQSLHVSDFEVVDFGTVHQPFAIDYPTNEWPDCVRTPGSQFP